MKTTMSKPVRWMSATGIGILAAWTLASCAGGPPKLPDISAEAKQSMEEATSFTYTRTDPDGVHDPELSLIEWSGQTDQANHHVLLELTQGTMELLVVDDEQTFLKLVPAESAEDGIFDLPGANGLWIQAPESQLDDVMGVDEEFSTTAQTAFSLIDELSEEELDTVESQETELDGQAVYKYTVPATAGHDSDLYTGSEKVAFYFLKESSELVQVEASSGESTATHAFTDINEVEVFEAPAEDEIAELDWSF